jgi:hypothetical protein
MIPSVTMAYIKIEQITSSIFVFQLSNIWQTILSHAKGSFTVQLANHHSLTNKTFEKSSRISPSDKTAFSFTVVF